MGATAVRHLCGRGRRNIGFVCFRLLRGLWAARWLDGVRLALMDGDMAHDQLALQVVGESADGPVTVAAAIAKVKPRLDGLILPDIHVAPRLLAELRKRGVEFAPQDVILGGSPAMAEQYGLGEYPNITEDGDSIVAVALDLLSSSSRNSPFNRVNLVVPFLTRNLD
jgi:DNA-binding LacI/PurR family transcriptional regulator